MMRRIFATMGVGIAALLLAVVLLLGWVLGTQSGSRALWAGVSGAVDGLAAESMEGRFAGPMAFEGLSFASDMMHLRIGSLKLEWAPGRLLGGELLVRELQVDDVAFTQLQPATPAAEDAEPFSPPEELSLPVAVVLRDIVLRGFEYRSAPDAAPVQVDEAALSASFRGTQLSIDELSARGPLFELLATASARTAGKYPATAAVDWRLSPPDMAPLTANLSIDGDLAQMRVAQTIAAPYHVSQEIEARDLLSEDMQLDVLVDINGSALQAIRGSLPPAEISGRLQADGSVTDLRYRATVDVDSSEFGALTLLASGTARDEVIAIDQVLLSRDPGDATLEFSGRADLAGPAPAFELRGDWRDLSWPLAGEPRISSPAGQFDVSGSAEDYSVNLDTSLAVPGQADGQLSLSGRGGSQAFALDDLQLNLLEGTLAGRGRIQWRPEIRGSVTLDGHGLDPSVLAPAFPGNLKLSLRAEGGFSDGDADAEVETLAVSGTLRQRPVDVLVQGGFHSARLRLDTLKARSGDTRIGATGSVGDSVDLQWRIDSPDLGHLVPGAEGSLAGEGSVAGSASLPAVRSSLQGNDIAYAGYRLERLALDLNIDPDPNAASSRLDLTLDQALFAGTEIRQVRVTGAGSRGDHQLNLDLESPEGHARLALGGAFEDKRWNGRLLQGKLRYAQFAAWELDGTQFLRLGSDGQHLESGCWRSGDSRLCLQGRRVGDDMTAAVTLSDFGLAYLQPMIPDALALSGLLEARVDFQQQSDSTPELEITADAAAVELRVGEASDQADELLLGLKPSRVSLAYGHAGVLAEVSMPFEAGGGIDARARVDGGSDPLTERQLRGKLVMALEDISFLDALSPEITAMTGGLNADFDISGTLADPVPEGEMQLADGTLELGAPGLNIRDIDVQLSSSSASMFDFRGSATSGAGSLQLDGSTRLDGAQTTVDVNIAGDAFEVLNTVDARVFVSPDLQVAVRENGIVINGEVRVPRADITPTELPRSVVTASSDEVVVAESSDGESTEGAQRELEARIRLVLGDAVSLDGFGLKGRLAGSVRITQMPGQPTLGSGEVTILNGEYRAYGQGLVIDKGKILFAGGPIAQPGINVRALRRPAEGIVVGVSARGPLKNPDFSVFSEPAMTQSEQLSWLVLGRPLDGASEGEGNMIAQAALALGLKGGNFLADRLGGGLGVDSVGIETGSGEAGAASDVNQAAFVIGKYLSPDLFVSYGIGLFDSVSTVKLEYSLTERWKVSTESSTLSSGGDVTYTLER